MFYLHVLKYVMFRPWLPPKSLDIAPSDFNIFGQLILNVAVHIGLIALKWYNTWKMPSKKSVMS